MQSKVQTGGCGFTHQCRHQEPSLPANTSSLCMLPACVPCSGARPQMPLVGPFQDVLCAAAC